MTITLRDNSTTTSHRLDLIPSNDDRCLSFPISDILPSQEPISKVWYTPQSLNQGNTGGCAGFATTGIIRAEPGIQDPLEYDADFAITRLYWPAQMNDPFPGGEYPGGDGSQGTTLVAVLSEARKQGLITGWKNAFSLEQMILGIGYRGPALMGTTWKDGMEYPNQDGRVHYNGRRLGGHAYICYGVNLRNGKVSFQNSWGANWGCNGRFWMSMGDVAAMIGDGCEVVFCEKVGV